MTCSKTSPAPPYSWDHMRMKDIPMETGHTGIRRSQIPPRTPSRKFPMRLDTPADGVPPSRMHGGASNAHCLHSPAPAPVLHSAPRGAQAFFACAACVHMSAPCQVVRWSPSSWRPRISVSRTPPRARAHRNPPPPRARPLAAS